jgi:ribose-phosphate pyrophosphokinase
VCCTNLIYRTKELLAREWYLDTNMIAYVARIIDALNTDESVYDLINSTSRLTDLVSQIRIGEVFDEFDE